MAQIESGKCDFDLVSVSESAAVESSEAHSETKKHVGGETQESSKHQNKEVKSKGVEMFSSLKEGQREEVEGAGLSLDFHHVHVRCVSTPLSVNIHL